MSTFMPAAFRTTRTVPSTVPEGDVEVGLFEERARQGSAARGGHRHGHRGPARAGAGRAAPRPPRPPPGKSIRCWTSTGAGMRVAIAAMSPVVEWQAVHFPSPLKYASPALGSPVTMLPTSNTSEPRSVSLMRCRRKCGELQHLRVGQPGARLAALHRMPLLHERAEQGAEAIVEDDERADQAGRIVRATRGRTVAGHALTGVEGPAAIGRRGIDGWTIGRPDEGSWTDGRRRLAGATLREPGRRGEETGEGEGDERL